ncbi:ROK family protein [Verrucomicrobiaceae bacterium 227]
MPHPVELTPIHRPELDPAFLPASLWNRHFSQLGQQFGTNPIRIALLRPDGTGSIHEDCLLSPSAPDSTALNTRHLERTVKFLLWSRSGNQVVIEGAPGFIAELAEIYSPTGARAFDVEFVQKVFKAGLTITDSADSSFPSPLKSEPFGGASTALRGNRIGFDLGGSDRKCAALINGEVVFSEEITWDPYFEKDPSYHYDGIMDSLRRAAAHLPSVDAIGGSAAGVYVDNKVRAASLFRGVPEVLFESRVENIFLDIAQEWNDVPIRVVNDGDVTALAGAMSLKSGNVLGLAMGTSAAAGYVDSESKITPWLSELAFVPIDYRENGPEDEWSGDQGCAVQYFSQQAVVRLIPASGLQIDSSLSKAEQLVEVQKAMTEGDDRAAAIYRSIGVYLGYAIPQFTRFYDVQHLLLLGRVMSGQGGEIIIAEAQKVLNDEFPEITSGVSISTPDEKMKRHGQAIAAASLPRLRKSVEA